MTALYIVTFGSFIGFSMALPLSITVIFGVQHVPDADRRDAAHAEEPERAVRADLRLDRPLRRRADPPGGRLDLRQGGRLDRHPDHLGGDGGGLGRRRLRDDAGLRARRRRRSTSPLFMLLFVRAVRRQRHRQRLHLPHHRRDLRPPAGRPGAGLDVGGRRLRRLHRAGGDRRPDQGRHAGVRDVRLRHVLRRCAWS